MANNEIAAQNPATKPNRYRPYTYFDEDMKLQFLSWLDQGYSLAGAAKRTGTTPSTAWNHRQSDPDFDAAVVAALDVGADELEDWMLDKARQPGGFLANIASLKARRPHKWGDRQQLDVNISGQVDMFLIADAVHQVQAPAQAQIVPGEYTELAQEAGTDVRDTADDTHNGTGYDADSST